MAEIVVAAFQSAASAADTYVNLGFVPHVIIGYLDNRATNPNTRVWFNRDVFSTWQAGADDTILTTGSTGVDTVDTASFAKYEGGEIVTAAQVTAENHKDRAGSILAAGTRTKAGFLVPAGDQTNSGYNHFICIKADTPKV